MPTPTPTHDRKHLRRLARAQKLVSRIDHPGLDPAPLAPPDATRGGSAGSARRGAEGPLIDGALLATRLAARGPLPVDDALALAHDVLDALAAAHARGLVHGQIGPAVVRHDPARWIVGGLTDALATSSTQDEREDIRGVGVLLYHALTGAAPFQVSHEALPAQLRPTILRCLQRDPERRFGSARELAAALGVPIPLPVVRPVSRRSKSFLLAAAAAGLAVAGAGVVVSRAARRQTVATVAAPVVAPRAARTLVALAARGRADEPSTGRHAAQARAVLAALLEGADVDVVAWDPARPPEDAAALGAQAVITVGASLRGDTLALELDLADVASGARRLAMRIEAPPRPGALAVTLAPIATKLGAALSPAVKLVPPVGVDAPAWDAYLAGIEAEQAGELEAALLAHERAGTLAPPFVAPRLRLARLYAAEGREADAARVAHELLAIPGLSEETTLWARAAGGATLAERRAALGELVARRPADAALALEHATLARRLGDPAGCRTEAGRAATLDAAKAPAANALGARCALEAGDLAAAEELARTADDVAAGDLALATGRYAAAQAAYRRASDQNLPGASARTLLVEIHGTGRCRLALDSAAARSYRAEPAARPALAWSWGQAAAACGDWTQGREAADWAKKVGLSSEATEILVWLDASRGGRGVFARAKTWAADAHWTGTALERARRFGPLARAARTPAEATEALALIGAPAWSDRLLLDAAPLAAEVSRLHALAGDGAAATAACADVIGAAPAYVPGLACRARAASARGDHAAAVAALRELLDRWTGAEDENRIVRDARRDLRKELDAMHDDSLAAAAP